MTIINLNVKTLDGQSHSMESVDDSLTVSQFKEEVGRMLGLDARSLRMIYSGRVLQDERVLSEFELNSKTVHVVQRAPPQTQRPNPPEPSPSVAQPTPERRFPFPTIEVLMPLRALENPLRAIDLSRATGRLYHAGSMLNRAKRIISELENQSRGGAAPERPPRDEPVPGPSSSPNGQSREPEWQNGSDTSAFPRNVRRFAALMRDYRETHSRIVPFLEEVENALEVPNRSRAQQNQALFEDVTEAMHLLSHVLHAISDSAIDFREDGPLYVRSRAGGSEASEPSVQSAGVSVRVRTPRTTLASVTPGTSRTLNLMISGDWQPRASTSTTQSTTSTPSVASSSSTTTGAPPAPPTTSASGASTTAALTASTGNQMMSFLDLVMGMTPQASGGSVGDAASISISTAVDLQRELQSVVQVALGEAARSVTTSMDSNNETTIRVQGSTVIPNTTSTQAATPGRPSTQSDEIPSFFDELRSVIQSFVPPSTNASSSSTSVPTSAPTTSSSTAPSSGSASASTTQNSASATSGAQSSGTATTATGTPILITAEAETMARPGFSDPRIQRFFHRAHQSQRNFERDPFLVCGSWRVPASAPGPRGSEAFAELLERSRSRAAQSTSSTAASNSQTPTASSSRTTTENQPSRSGGDQQNNFGQRLLPVFQELRNSSPGLSVPDLQSVLQPEMGPNGPLPNNLLLAEVLGFGRDPAAEMTMLHEAIMAGAQEITITDFLSVITGNYTFFSRIQQPVAEVLRRRMFLDGSISIEEGVLRVIDELHPFIDRVAREANTTPPFDMSESLNKFLHSRLLAICLCLFNCSNDQFSESMMTLLGNAMENFVLLLIKGSLDGPQSCERVVRAIIEQMVEDGDFPPPAVYIVIAHLRNYMARVQRERGEERVDHWLVSLDSDEYRNRQSARRQRLESRGANSNTEEVETFVTPRSSPDPMDTESGMISIQEQVAEESRPTERPSSDSVIPPSMRSNDLPFPRELLMSTNTRTEASGRQGPWHAHLPRDWVAIVDRDAERQANQPPQPPFSDGYLSMQPAKRRRMVTDKPSGDLSSVIAETIRDAISASGVSPVSSVNSVVNEAAGSASLARAVEAETRKIASENISRSPSDCEKFPNFSEFAKK